MNSCSRWQLYVIIDRTAVDGRDVVEVASAAIRGGADVIQLRDKTASTRELLEEAGRLMPLAHAAGIPLIINDRADVAHAANADGVHLGQDDLPVQAARSLLGSGRLIGRSTHSLEQALDAESAGAEYIGFGPIFSTPTKPAYQAVGTALIREVVTRVRIPVVCIGGIDERNLAEVLRAGATRVAVVRAVCAVAHPEIAARTLKDQLEQFLHSNAPSGL